MCQRWTSIIGERPEQSVDWTRQRADLIVVIAINKARLVTITSMVGAKGRLTYQVVTLRIEIASNVWNTCGSVARDNCIAYVCCSTIVNSLTVLDVAGAYRGVSCDGAVRQRDRSAAIVVDTTAASII